MQSSEIAVQFRDVSYAERGKFLVSNINLKVETGEILVLLGRSGSGKTTTMRLINRLLTPTSGEVLVNTKPTTTWNAIELRRQIGYAIQDTGLFPHFTVEQNVGLVPSLIGWKPKQIKTRAQELLHLVGLPPNEFGDRYPRQLSGGQKQRVGIARALAADPPILLMDEPFGALDPITRMELQQEFKTLQSRLQKTAVFVTHDIQEAFILASRIGLMDGGKLVELATPEAFKQSQTLQAQSFLSVWRSIRA